MRDRRALHTDRESHTLREPAWGWARAGGLAACLLLGLSSLSGSAHAKDEVRLGILDADAVLTRVIEATMDQMRAGASTLPRAQCEGGRTGPRCLPRIPFTRTLDEDDWSPTYDDRHGKRAPVYKSGLMSTQVELLIRDQHLNPEASILSDATVEILPYGTEITDRGIPFEMTLPSLEFTVDFNLDLTVVDRTMVAGADACDGWIGIASFIYPWMRLAAVKADPCNLYVYPDGHTPPYADGDPLPVTLDGINWYANADLDLEAFQMRGITLRGWIQPEVEGEVVTTRIIFGSDTPGEGGLEVHDTSSIGALDGVITLGTDTTLLWGLIPLPEVTVPVSCTDAVSIRCTSIYDVLRDLLLEMGWGGEEALVTLELYVEQLDRDIESAINDQLNTVLSSPEILEVAEEALGDAAQYVAEWSEGSAFGGTTARVTATPDEITTWSDSDLVEDWVTAPFDVESVVDLDFGFGGIRDACAAGLLPPIERPGVRYRPAFDPGFLPGRHLTGLSRDEHDEVAGARREAAQAPAYEHRHNLDMQMSMTYSVFEQVGYAAGRAGALCHNASVPIVNPATGGSVSMPLAITPAGRVTASKGTYLPMEAFSGLDVIMRMSTVGFGGGAEETTFRVDYDTMQSMTSTTPVEAVQLQVPMTVTGSQAVRGGTLSVNAQLTVDIFIDPTVSCDNGLAFITRSMQAGGLSGQVVFNPAFGPAHKSALGAGPTSVAILDQINRALYRQYQPSYYIVRRNEPACVGGINTDMGGYYYELYTIPNPDSVIGTGANVTSVELLGLHTTLGGFTLHDNYMLADAYFSRSCYVPRATYGYDGCEEMRAPPTIFGVEPARDYVEGAQALNDYQETMVDMATRQAWIIEDLYGIEAMRAFQRAILEGQMVGPIHPQELNHLYGAGFLFEVAQGQVEAVSQMVSLFDGLTLSPTASFQLVPMLGQ